MLHVSSLSLRIVGATLLTSVFTALPSSGADVLSADLIAAIGEKPNANVRVIVQTASRSDASTGSLPARFGGRTVFTFKRFNGYVAELPGRSVRRLAAMRGVAHISPDRPVSASFRKLPPGGYTGPWYAAARSVGADGVWNALANADGTGVSVAVLDTGIAPTSEFRVAAFVDLVNHRAAPYDDNGHGTHVAGIVAGGGVASGGRSGNFPGTAPGAAVVGVKVLDANAGGLASTVIQGIDWCVANKQTYKIGVINLSLGQGVRESSTTDPLCQACERAVAAGIVVVVAAGNNGDGYGGITCPGNDPAVITVGAMRTCGTAIRSDDVITSYTSRGPTMVDHYAKPDVLAPGNRIVSVRAAGSTLDTLHPGNRVAPWAYGGSAESGAPYFVLSGTSMAAPVVSGAAALILSNNAALSPNAVKAALMVSAQSVGGFDPVLDTCVQRYDWMTQGAGYLNIAGAVRCASFIGIGLANEPGDTEVPADWGADTIQGESVLWGNSILWGNMAVSAGDFSVFKHVNWDRSVLWGDSCFWSGGIVPEEDAVSVTSVLWGNYPARRMSALNVLATGE